MSLRGAKRLRGEAEANSCVITRLLHFVRNDTLCQIATLPTVARNDKRGLRHSLLRLATRNARFSKLPYFKVEASGRRLPRFVRGNRGAAENLWCLLSK